MPADCRESKRKGAKEEAEAGKGKEKGEEETLRMNRTICPGGSKGEKRRREKQNYGAEQYATSWTLKGRRKTKEREKGMDKERKGKKGEGERMMQQRIEVREKEQREKEFPRAS